MSPQLAIIEVSLKAMKKTSAIFAARLISSPLSSDDFKTSLSTNVSVLHKIWPHWNSSPSTCLVVFETYNPATMNPPFISLFILGPFGKTGAFRIILIQAGTILVIKGMRGSLRMRYLNFSHFQHRIRLDSSRVSNQTPFRRPQKCENQVAWGGCTDLFMGVLQAVHCKEIYTSAPWHSLELLNILNASAMHSFEHGWVG